MRWLILLCSAVAGLALSSGALGATTAPAATEAITKTVSIRADGFAPSTVGITADDTIRWRNDDSKNHQIVSTRGTFASPVIAPGHSYTFTFAVAGNYDYRDALYPKLRGTVKVAGLPPAVTLGVDLPQITYGTAVMLTGQVNSKKAGEQVTLASTPFGQPLPVVLANVITGPNGTFAFRTTPRWLTSYQATWKGVASLAASVSVAPVITFGRNNGWITHVYAGRSMAAKTVQVQTVSKFGQWITIKRVSLGSASRARFSLNLTRGVHRLRMAMSVNQAGVGYLGALQPRGALARGLTADLPQSVA